MSKERPLWFKKLGRETQQFIREVEFMAAQVGHEFVADKEKAEKFDRASRNIQRRTPPHMTQRR